MKKANKLLVIAISVIIVICAVAIAAGAALSSGTARDILQDIVGGSTDSSTQDLNADGAVNILDVILAIKLDNGPLLTTLQLDESVNGKNIEFNDKTLNYTVTLPAGRPRVPRLVATAQTGLTIDYQQATIADTENEGSAKVTVSNGNKTNTYTVKFVREAVASKNATIELQYDDRWTFKPKGTEGRSVVFTTSNSSLATVDSNGVIHAKDVTDTDVTITAKVNGTAVDTLKISKIHKAQINLFLVTGQSNAQGCYDYTSGSTAAEQTQQTNAQLAYVDQPTQYGQVYSYDIYPYKGGTLANTKYDMLNYKRSGFASALGKTWYNLTGEKVYFIQSAYSGSPIEAWIKNTHEEAGSYGNHYFYNETLSAYKKVVASLEPATNAKYEIVRKANFWLQGETGMSWIYDKENTTGDWWLSSSEPGFDVNNLMNSDQYYDYFKLIHDDMKKDFGIEANNILLVRATAGASSSESQKLQLLTDINAVRAAQYSLANNNPDIALVSRVSDIARMGSYSDNTVIGHGYMGVGNLHYNQIGHNANGVAAATNYFKAIDVDTNSSAAEVEIIDTNGRTRLNSKDVIEMLKGSTKNLAAMALPEYSRADVEWKSSNSSVATIDKHGLITALNVGETVITAEADNGKAQSVKVVVYEVEEQKINYTWNFNDLTGTNGNNLSLSPLAANKGNNYTLSNGIYSTKEVYGTPADRPDFTVSKPFTLDSQHDWTIEWKYFAAGGSNVTLMGQTPTAEDTATVKGYIYLCHSSDWGNGLYPLKFVPQDGADVTINYGDKRSLNNNWNTWKLSYTAQTKTMTLQVSENEGVTWDNVGSATTGTFKSTITNIFGRNRADGWLNFTGSVDYIKVDVVETVRVTN